LPKVFEYGLGKGKELFKRIDRVRGASAYGETFIGKGGGRRSKTLVAKKSEW
jgi:hypothetical protein